MRGTPIDRGFSRRTFGVPFFRAPSLPAARWLPVPSASATHSQHPLTATWLRRCHFLVTPTPLSGHTGTTSIRATPFPAPLNRHLVTVVPLSSYFHSTFWLYRHHLRFHVAQCSYFVARCNRFEALCCNRTAEEGFTQAGRCVLLHNALISLQLATLLKHCATFVRRTGLLRVKWVRGWCSWARRKQKTA